MWTHHGNIMALTQVPSFEGWQQRQFEATTIEFLGGVAADALIARSGRLFARKVSEVASLLGPSICLLLVPSRSTGAAAVVLVTTWLTSSARLSPIA